MTIHSAVVPSPSKGSREASLTADDISQSWIRIVRGEYLEVPGLALTRSQVRRLFGLDDVMCDRVVEALVGVRFLHRTPDGVLVRANGSRG